MAHRKHISKPSTDLAGDAAIRSHAHKRLDRMTLMGLILPQLVNARKIIAPTLSHQHATIQAGRGTRGTQAAHNLPVDLMLNGVPIWEYAKKDSVLNVNPNIRTQIYYSSAATVTVPAISNYLDSRWEQSPLPQEWLTYLGTCVENAGAIGRPGALDPRIRLAAEQFRSACDSTLASTITRIEESTYYAPHQEALDNVFQIYEDRLDQYHPIGRLETMWRIYQRPEYQ